MTEVKAQDIVVDNSAINKIAKKLACNDVAVRNRTLTNLRLLLERSSKSNDGVFCELNLLRLWKGLHYCMWMADKPLFQEELAEKFSALISIFKIPEQSAEFVSAFLKVEGMEWHLLDFLRLDKFMMLIRKMINQTIELLHSRNWPTSVTEKLVANIDNTFTSTNVASGFIGHVLNVIRDALRDMRDGNSTENMEWCEPFVELFSRRKETLFRNVNGEKKHKKKISAAEFKKTFKDLVTEKEINIAVNEMLEFENENTIQDRATKKRERKRKRDADDEFEILEADQDNSSEPMESEDASNDKKRFAGSSNESDDDNMEVSVTPKKKKKAKHSNKKKGAKGKASLLTKGSKGKASKPTIPKKKLGAKLHRKQYRK